MGRWKLKRQLLPDGRYLPPYYHFGRDGTVKLTVQYIQALKFSDEDKFDKLLVTNQTILDS